MSWIPDNLVARLLVGDVVSKLFPKPGLFTEDIWMLYLLYGMFLTSTLFIEAGLSFCGTIKFGFSSSSLIIELLNLDSLIFSLFFLNC